MIFLLYLYFKSDPLRGESDLKSCSTDHDRPSSSVEVPSSGREGLDPLTLLKPL